MEASVAGEHEALGVDKFREFFLSKLKEHGLDNPKKIDEQSDDWKDDFFSDIERNWAEREAARLESLELLKEAANQLDHFGEYEMANELTNLLKKFAGFPKDLTKEEKKYLREAEEAVEDTYDPDKSKAQQGKYYGIVTNIFKAKVKKHLGYDPFKKRKKKKKDKSKKGKDNKKKNKEKKK